MTRHTPTRRLLPFRRRHAAVAPQNFFSSNLAKRKNRAYNPPTKRFYGSGASPKEPIRPHLICSRPRTRFDILIQLSHRVLRNLSSQGP